MNLKKLKIITLFFASGIMLLSCEKDQLAVNETGEAKADKVRLELISKYTSNIIGDDSFPDAVSFLNQNINAVKEPIQTAINTDPNSVAPVQTPEFDDQESILYNWALGIYNQNNSFAGLTDEEIEAVLENAFASEPLPSPPEVSSLSSSCAGAFTARWNKNAGDYRVSAFLCFLQAFRGSPLSGALCISGKFIELDLKQRQAFADYQECMRQKLSPSGYGEALFSFLNVNEFSSNEDVIAVKQRLRSFNSIIGPALGSAIYNNALGIGSELVLTYVKNYITINKIHLSVYEYNDLVLYINIVYRYDFQLPMEWANALYDVSIVKDSNGIISGYCYGIWIQGAQIILPDN